MSEVQPTKVHPSPITGKLGAIFTMIGAGIMLIVQIASAPISLLGYGFLLAGLVLGIIGHVQASQVPNTSKIESILAWVVAGLVLVLSLPLF